MDSEHVRAARWAATATVLSSLIVAAGTLAATGKFSGGNTSAAVARMEASPSTSMLSDSAGLKFDKQTDLAPWCAQFVGSGAIPKGHALVIFDRSADEPGSPLYFDGTATATATGWVSPKLHIGDKGDRGLRISLLAFLVTEQQAKFIESIRVLPVDATQPVNGAWMSAGPTSPADEWIVTRTADLGSCSQ